MASYVKLIRAIWQDPDFVRLPAAAQRVYMLLFSQPDITHVGILPLMPTRWARLAPDTSPAQIREALDSLAVDNYVLLDESTEELWVRSYIVHDEAFRLTNGTKSLVKAYERVLSLPFQHQIATVLATVGVTVETRVAVSQQPAAITMTSNQQPASPTQDADDFDGAVTNPVAAAALTMLLRLRVAKAHTNPGGLKAKLLKELPAEHAQAIDAYLRDHPEADASELAVKVLGLPATFATSASEATHIAAQQMSGAGYGRAVADEMIRNHGPDEAAFLIEIADRPEHWRDAALVAYRATVDAQPSNVVNLRRPS